MTDSAAAAVLGFAVASPLAGLGLCLLVARRASARQIAGVTFSASAFVLAGILFWHVATTGTVIAEIGGWPAPVGITLVADRLAAGVMLVSATVVLATHVFGIRTDRMESNWPNFHAAHVALGGGLTLAFASGDLFTLFVGFEVALMASYTLLTAAGPLPAGRSGLLYIVTNVLVSALFLIAIAAVYAVTGSLNMAAIATVWPTLGEPLRTGIGLLLLVTFATKAAAFPLFGWLPGPYREAHPAIASVFAGLLTKLGVYALFRTHTLFGLTGDSQAWVLAFIAGATMLGGVLAAYGQTEVRRILSFHITSQVGYMLFGLAVLTEAALAGAVFYLLHHILVKTTLFMVAGMIERDGGSGKLSEIGGMRATAPVLAILFALPALSLAGIPPFSGFVAKLALVAASIEAGAWVLLGVSLVTSLLTVLSMAKIWSGAFWGDVPDPAPAVSEDTGRGTVAVAGLAAASIVVALVAGPLLTYSQQAATDLLDPGVYIGEVLPS
ncbi:proton-conducting transporter membrane subunit [Euzebya tangerina]|uniref:proton-conducting transporter transmembrane domain-containing protein n=1 Tax=Euzebya tangerina TaxID=591198 RepID=UPI000E310E0E|nr:proton-conducting transporter membrane subunit [Euzebya tangerina]